MGAKERNYPRHQGVKLMAICSYPSKRIIPDGPYCGKCAWVCPPHAPKECSVLVP